MSTEENKALVRGFYEAWGTQGVAAFDQFCAPSFVDHACPPACRRRLRAPRWPWVFSRPPSPTWAPPQRTWLPKGIRSWVHVLQRHPPWRFPGRAPDRQTREDRIVRHVPHRGRQVGRTLVRLRRPGHVLFDGKLSRTPRTRLQNGIVRSYTLSDNLSRQQSVCLRQDLMAFLRRVRSFLTHILSLERQMVCRRVVATLRTPCPVSSG
jgi:hypothetical protein